jgi:hypothetical protein
MTRTKTKPLTVAEAAKRAEESRDRLRDLTSRLKNGDTAVSREELNDARDEAEYADLALQGAQARERREAEEQLRKDVDSFRASFPARLAEPFAEVAAQRQKAVDAVGALIDAVSELQRVREDIRFEYAELRPPDVPLGHDKELPGWYRTANPRDYTGVPNLDWFKAALAATREAMARRHRGHWTTEQGEWVRNIDKHVAAQESQVNHARKRLDT